MMTDFQVNVGTTSTLVRPNNSSRREVYIYNDSQIKVVYIALNTSAASGVGVRLNPGQGWSTKDHSAVYAITASGSGAASIVGSEI